MNAEELRMECLRLALARTNEATDTLKLAKAFAGFVFGIEPLTSREQVIAALDAAGVR